MRKAFSALTEAAPADLFDVVSDLETYPAWLDVVDAAEPADGPDTWIITLRARVGPFARSKRLRMARVGGAVPTSEGGQTVRFERHELDGKSHSAWTMAAEVSQTDAPDARSEVVLDLIYDGGMWTGLLDGVLDDAAERAAKRLAEYVRP